MGKTPRSSRTCRTAGCGTVFLLLTLALYACSGGSGPGSADGTAPTAAITFPGTTASIASGHLIVHGTANDQSAIARVRVNGVDATSSDGFATWEATLDLPAGRNSLTVGTEDVLGNRNAAAAVATVTVGPLFVDVQGIAVESTGQLVIADGNRVVRADPVSGARTIVSDETTGSGPALLGILSGIAVEPTGQLIVWGGRRLMRVDPRSGARTIVSDETTGSGPTFEWVADIAVEATGQLIVADWIRVTRVDPLSGARTIVSGARTFGSDETIGSGPAIKRVTYIAVEATGQLVVADSGRVMRIDPVSGARTIISDEATGSGPAFGSLYGLAVEASGQIVTANTSITSPESFLGGNRVVRVDPRSGARTIVSDETTGSGPAITGIKDIAVEATGQLVVVDGAANSALPQRVLRVDPLIGTRTVVSEATAGAGPFILNSPRGIAVESTGQIIVLDSISWIGRVVRVDPNTGTRTIVSDDAIGSGPMLRSEARGIAVEPSGGLVVLDAAPQVLGWVDDGRVVRVDPASGARTIVSENGTTGSGPQFNVIKGIAVEPTGQIIVFESYRVLRVDPVSGARTIVSDATTGSGPPFDSLTAMAVEPTGQIVVAGGVTGGGSSVVRIDPRSGARTALISTPGSGYIPPYTHGLGRPFFRDIAVEPSGQIIVVDIFSDVPRGELVRIDPISRGRTVISNAIDFTDLGIAVEAPGRLVTLSGHSLLRVDLRNGAFAIISQ